MKPGPRRSSAYISIMNVTATTPYAVTALMSASLVARPHRPQRITLADGGPERGAQRARLGASTR